MSPTRLGPSAVAPATVRRVPGHGAEQGRPVQRVAVPLVPSPRVAPGRADPVVLRVLALERENDRLRAQLEQLRSA